MIAHETLWIEQARHGNDVAFGFLVDAYQNPVFSLCYRMLGNTMDAEDAAQESFIRAFQHLRKYDPDRPFGTWLLSIAAHYCIDRVCKRRLTSVSMDALSAEIIPDRSAPNPEREYRRGEKETRIQNILSGLKPIDRAAVVLRYWHDCSEVDIAKALGLTVSAVKSRLYRSRQSLAKAWMSSENLDSLKERKPHESPAF